MRILDIDLDFFLNNKHFGSVVNENRLPSDKFQAYSEEEFVRYLEDKCGLSRNQRICGKVFTHHDEVFYYLRDLQGKNNFELSFDIDHLDAHADLGHGDASHLYISSEILNLPLTKRCFPSKTKGLEGLGAGNYLSFAIASQWLTSLNYITKPDWNKDIPWFHFKDFDISSNIIEMKKFTMEQVEKIKMFCTPESMNKFTPVLLEPEIPFNYINSNIFESDGNYDYIFLTQSPGFTPEASDLLIPIFEEYIYDCY